LRLANDGYEMTHEEAKSAISDVTLGLDMTLRTRQLALKTWPSLDNSKSI
jgi:2-keto-4-pentenoate hydratase/2-oxohepta-3-ene-1,7-dioic acid hydratase in catechol pathway